MKHSLFFSVLAAALLGCVAAHAETFYASEYSGGSVEIGSDCTVTDYDTLKVNQSLSLTGIEGYLGLWGGATLTFCKDAEADAICSISTSAKLKEETVRFNDVSYVYNITFDVGAEVIVAASAGSAITLIQDASLLNFGFFFQGGSEHPTLRLNGVGYNQPVEIGGVQFIYVGPKLSDYTFKEGEIGFTGYYNGSHALKLVANAPAVPEPPQAPWVCWPLPLSA